MRIFNRFYLKGILMKADTVTKVAPLFSGTITILRALYIAV